MYRMWLKVNDSGVIAQSLYTSAPTEPDGYNFVVDDQDLITQLRNTTTNWYVRDDQLCKKAELQLVLSYSTEDGKLKANGTDHVAVKVEGCPLDVAKIRVSQTVIEVPVDDELIINSNVHTIFTLYAEEVEYYTKTRIFVEFA